MNKQIISLIALCLICTIGCKKSSSAEPDPPNEEVRIADYLVATNQTAVRDPSGIYYRIIEPGTGETPNNQSTVVLTYSGRVINGDQFAMVKNEAFKLQNVIEGWQIAIPKIKPGGHIVLYLPSKFSYGFHSPKAGIPPYATLMFDIEFVGYSK